MPTLSRQLDHKGGAGRRNWATHIQFFSGPTHPVTHSTSCTRGYRYLGQISPPGKQRRGEVLFPLNRTWLDFPPVDAFDSLFLKPVSLYRMKNLNQTNTKDFCALSHWEAQQLNGSTDASSISILLQKVSAGALHMLAVTDLFKHSL